MSASQLVDLNPRDVLEHLHELGYSNITADQLKEFIKDLKKLMKYDQRNKQRKSAVAEESLKSSDDDSDEEENLENVRSRLDVPRQQRRFCTSPLTASMARSNLRRPGDELTNNCQRTVYSTSGTSVDVVDSRSNSCRARSETRATSSTTQSRRSCHCPAKENVPTRSSSFIRPWKLQPNVAKQHGPVSSKNDPVSLYHKYQELWRQNKFPGEETHNGLRWNIRERMLGTDPQPRPVSQASSMESMAARRRMTRM